MSADTMNGFWNLTDADIEAIIGQPSPLDEMREQIMAQAMGHLARGSAVTFTSGGKRLYTIYPDGTTEHHGWAV